MLLSQGPTDRRQKSLLPNQLYYLHTTTTTRVLFKKYVQLLHIKSVVAKYISSI